MSVAPDYDRLLQEYVEGGLAGADRARLAELLAGDPALLAAFARDAQDAALVTSALRPRDAGATARSIRHVLDSRRSSRRARLVADIRGRIAPRRRAWPRFAGAAAIAAAILAAVVLLRAGPPADPALPTIAGAGAGGGRAVAGAPLATGPGTIARYDDGTVVDLAGGSQVAFSASGGGKRIRLDRGSLRAEVAKQPSPLVIVTPHAEIVVVGTRFTLAVDVARTRLEVADGAVRLTRLADGAAVAVAAGESCEADRGTGPLLAVRRPAPAPTTGSEVGVVSGLVVTSDRVPDFSSIEAWRRATVAGAASDQDKALAIWAAVRTYVVGDLPTPWTFIGPGQPEDPLEAINVYGYGSHDVSAGAVIGFARALGLEARAWTVVDHVVPEIRWDGGWHALDASAGCWFPRADGAPASVDELIAEVSAWSAAHPGLAGDAQALDRFARDPGWKQGPPLLARCPQFDAAGDLPGQPGAWRLCMQAYSGAKREPWAQGSSLGYRAQAQLRVGERLVRGWSNRGLHVGVGLGEGDPRGLRRSLDDPAWAYLRAAGNRANELIGNGTVEYQPPLADGRFRGGALACDNLACTGEDGKQPALHPRDPAVPGVYELRLPTSYVYLAGVCELETVVASGGSIAVAISTNHGLDWRELGRRSEGGAWRVDLSPSILRRHDYRLRITLAGAGTGLSSLRVVGDIQHAQAALPALAAGDNAIALAASNEGTVTLEPAMILEWRDRQVSYLDLHAQIDGLAPPVLTASGSVDGSITVPLTAPGPIRRLRVDLRFLGSGGWDAAASFDRGGSWYPVSGDTPAPDLASEALVRLAAHPQGGRTGLLGFRIDADYVEPHGGFRPVQVTYEWTEDGAPKRDAHIARHPGETWTIHCGREPRMVALSLELAP